MQNDNAKFKTEFKNRFYSFTLRLIEFIDHLPNDNVSRRLGDQLLRSGTSIISNYTKAQAAGSKRDFINYFTISLKSCNESLLWLTLLKGSKRAQPEAAQPLLIVVA